MIEDALFNASAEEQARIASDPDTAPDLLLDLALSMGTATRRAALRNASLPIERYQASKGQEWDGDALLHNPSIVFAIAADPRADWVASLAYAKANDFQWTLPQAAALLYDRTWLFRQMMVLGFQILVVPWSDEVYEESRQNKFTRMPFVNHALNTVDERWSSYVGDIVEYAWKIAHHAPGSGNFDSARPFFHRVERVMGDDPDGSLRTVEALLDFQNALVAKRLRPKMKADDDFRRVPIPWRSEGLFALPLVKGSAIRSAHGLLRGHTGSARPEHLHGAATRSGGKQPVCGRSRDRAEPFVAPRHPARLPAFHALRLRDASVDEPRDTSGDAGAAQPRLPRLGSSAAKSQGGGLRNADGHRRDPRVAGWLLGSLGSCAPASLPTPHSLRAGGDHARAGPAHGSALLAAMERSLMTHLVDRLPPRGPILAAYNRLSSTEGAAHLPEMQVLWEVFPDRDSWIEAIDSARHEHDLHVLKTLLILASRILVSHRTLVRARPACALNQWHNVSELGVLAEHMAAHPSITNEQLADIAGLYMARSARNGFLQNPTLLFRLLEWDRYIQSFLMSSLIDEATEALQFLSRDRLRAMIGCLRDDVHRHEVMSCGHRKNGVNAFVRKAVYQLHSDVEAIERGLGLRDRAKQWSVFDLVPILKTYTLLEEVDENQRLVPSIQSTVDQMRLVVSLCDRMWSLLEPIEPRPTFAYALLVMGEEAQRL